MTPPRDVHPAAFAQQWSLIMAMSPAERFQLGMRWIEMGQQVMEARIRAEHPDFTQAEVVIAIFERCHGHLFAGEVKARLIASIREAHGR